ncbi:MAG TPA: aminotransferase class V-fold PLP-dependent enzyme [Candidatus Paceibacterota bacterium]
MMNFFKKLHHKRQLAKFFDYAAHTPMRDEVIQVMEDEIREYGNPSSIHGYGVAAQKKIEDARTRIANIFKVSSSEIIFTPGGTASINLAIQGVLGAFSQQFPDRTPHIITSNVEHSAVRQTVRNLTELGVITSTELPVNEFGIVAAADVISAVTEDTVLVTMMMVNNEYGAVFPIQEIGKALFVYKKETSVQYPLFHVDASQAFLPFEIIPRSLHIDVLSCSSAKTYGPAHGGVLYARKGIKLSEIMYGGSQEQKLWPGTQSVADIVAAVASFELAAREREQEVMRVSELQSYVREQLQSSLAQEFGLQFSLPLENVSPYILHGYIEGVSSERLLLELDAYGYSISAQAACDSDKEGISEAVKALWSAQGNSSYEGDRAVFRISFGLYSNKKGIDGFIQALNNILKKFQQEQGLLK